MCKRWRWSSCMRRSFHLSISPSKNWPKNICSLKQLMSARILQAEIWEKLPPRPECPVIQIRWNQWTVSVKTVECFVVQNVICFTQYWNASWNFVLYMFYMRFPAYFVSSITPRPLCSWSLSVSTQSRSICTLTLIEDLQITSFWFYIVCSCQTIPSSSIRLPQNKTICVIWK